MLPVTVAATEMPPVAAPVRSMPSWALVLTVTVLPIVAVVTASPWMPSAEALETVRPWTSTPLARVRPLPAALVIVGAVAPAGTRVVPPIARPNFCP